MWFSRKNKIDHDHLVSVLATGTEAALYDLLWQPKRGQISYLPVTMTMLQKFQQEPSGENALSIFETIDKGKFQLIIFHLPGTDDVPYSPLILEKTSGKVVGVMLLLNELHGYFSKRNSATIGSLGMWWVKFAIDCRLKR